MDFAVKTISIKECARCKSTWVVEKVALETHDKIEFIKVKIAYCPVCKDGFAAEIDRPTYERSGKRLR